MVAPSVRSALAAGQLARDKGLGIVAGTQYRHEAAHIETIRRVQDAAIGEIVAAFAYYNRRSDSLSPPDARPAGRVG